MTDEQRPLAAARPRRLRTLGLTLCLGSIAGLILLPIAAKLLGVASSNSPGLGVVLYLLLTLPFVGAILLFVDSAAMKKERRRILETGVAAKAIVVKVEMAGTKETNGVDERWLVNLTLDVQPAESAAFEARIQHFVAVLDIPRVQPGQVLDVRYDANDTTRVAVV